MKIDHAIGPTFGTELLASGIPPQGIVWTADAVMVPDTLDPTQIDALRALVAAHDASAPPAPPVIVVSKSILFQRMSDAEYDLFAPILAKQSQRVRDVFDLVTVFRSDAPLWPLLTGIATGLYGAARSAELLAPTE